MDEQTQHLFSDPSASQSQPKRQLPPALSPDQSGVQQGSQLAPNHLQRANAAQSQLRSTRQLPPPGPQPILFSEVEVEFLEEEPPRPQRLRRTRRFLRSRTGRIVLPVLALLIGFAVGLSSLIWYGLSGEGPLVIVPPAARGNLVIQADKDFVTQLVRADLANAGLPGKVENVKVTLQHGAQIVVEGDDLYSVFGVSVSRHFTVNVQPYVQACILQVRVVSANLGGIPVTTFVQSFQGNVNRQLAKKPTGLPEGFAYCTVGVRTEPGGMFVTYQAIPVTPTP
jgi:hypothetical protein